MPCNLSLVFEFVDIRFPHLGESRPRSVELGAGKLDKISSRILEVAGPASIVGNYPSTGLTLADTVFKT